MNLDSTTVAITAENGARSSRYLGFTRRQLAFLVTYGLYNIFRGALVLIAGPFYPPEAEKRGITISTVGFVFAIYDFATFLAPLLYGKLLIPTFGPHRIIIFSAFNTTLCAVLFGCLGYINDRTQFLVFSFLIRFLGGAGDAGFYPSAFTIFMYEFPDLVSTTVGLFELFFGIGAILGPILCGYLIDSAGYELTYITVGGCLLFSAVLILILAPQPNLKAFESPSKEVNEAGAERGSGHGLIHLLTIPSIYYAIFSLFSTAVSIGFLTATLEAHLEQFNLSSVQVGAVFSVTTGIYTVCSPLWGQISDKLGWNKEVLIASGSVLIAIGFVFLGPLDFISRDYLLWGTLVGLSLHGIGIGSAIMVFFSYASESALANGFPDTTATYGLVSSIFTLTFSLGNAFGPAVSGSLYEAVGFKDASLSVIGLSLFVILSAGLLILMKKRR